MKAARGKLEHAVLLLWRHRLHPELALQVAWFASEPHPLTAWHPKEPYLRMHLGLRRLSLLSSPKARPQELPKTFAMLPVKAPPSSCWPPRGLVLVPSTRLSQSGCVSRPLSYACVKERVRFAGYFGGGGLPICNMPTSQQVAGRRPFLPLRAAVHVVRRHAKPLRITADSTQQEQSVKAHTQLLT